MKSSYLKSFRTFHSNIDLPSRKNLIQLSKTNFRDRANRIQNFNLYVRTLLKCLNFQNEIMALESDRFFQQYSNISIIIIRKYQTWLKRRINFSPPSNFWVNYNWLSEKTVYETKLSVYVLYRIRLSSKYFDVRPPNSGRKIIKILQRCETEDVWRSGVRIIYYG